MAKLGKKTLTGLSVSALAISVITLIAFSVENKSSLNAAGVFGETSDYTVILNSSNAYTSGTTQSVTTSSGSWQIDFSYTNCSALSGGHATLADGGKIVNSKNIVSVDYLKFDFDGTGTLKFRTSLDGTLWSGYSQAKDEEVYHLPSNPYYVELSVSGGSINLYSATYQYTCVDNPDAHVESGYRLATSTDDLVIGANCIIAYTDGESPVSMATTTHSYYRPGTGGTVEGNLFTPADDTDILTIVDGSSFAAGSYGFKSTTDDKYVYSSNSSYPNLRKGSTLAATSCYTVEFDSNGYASMTGNGTNTYKYVKYDAESSDATASMFISSSDASTYQSVRIYVEKQGPDAPSDLVGIEVTDTGTYTTESVYSSDNNLVVKGKYQDGSTSVLASTAYTYALSKTQGGAAIDKTAAFGEAGTYWVRVSYGELLPVDIQITVDVPPATIESISASLKTDSYTTSTNVVFTDNLTATLGMSDGSTVSDVAYADFGTYGLTATLINPSGVAQDLSTVLSVPGTYKARVSLSSDSTIYGEADIAVTAVAVQDVTLDKTTATLTVGKTLQLTATVNPTNALVKGVAWDSDNDSVASVDENGLVTANAVGTANISVVTTDGGFKATCAVTVNAAPTEKTFSLLTDINELSEGTELVIGSAANDAVAGDISSSVMTSVDATYSDNTITPPDGAVVLTVGGTSGAWTLANEDGQLLGGTAKKKVAWDSGTTTWSISVTSAGAATITNGTSSYGSFLYNTGSPRFTTYTSGASSSMVLPEIYYVPGTPVYASSITLSETSKTLYVGGTVDLTATVSPSDYNQGVTWTSSDPSVASVTKGLVTAVAIGSTTITATAIKEDGTKLTATCAITVSPVSVTGVSLNASTKEVSVGKTVELTATVAPSNATNKSVTWTSSNTSVATVSGGTVTGVAAGTATITATTADGGYKASCTVTVSTVVLDDWTIMIYMCGADLESGYASSNQGLATGDLKEIAAVTGQPDSVNVIVEAGGASSWSSTYSSVISKNYLNRFHLSNKSYVKDAQITKASMGLTSTFQSFLEWGLTEYPADRTMVVMWNHGGGMYGCCYDENFDNNALLGDEVKSALSGAFKSVGRTDKLEVIGYDCCLMQIQDNASLNDDYFNYMIASEESEAGYGWDYDGGWLGKIFNAPSTVSTSTVLTACCDNFITDNGGTSSSSNDQTLSWLNLSNMPAYVTAWEAMAKYMLDNSLITSSNKSSFITLVKSAKRYGYDSSDNSYDEYFGVIDAKDFLTKLAANSTFCPSAMSSLVTAAKNAFASVVGYSTCGKGAGNTYGLAMIFGLDNSYMKSYYTTARTEFTNWCQISYTYGDTNPTYSA